MMGVFNRLVIRCGLRGQEILLDRIRFAEKTAQEWSERGEGLLAQRWRTKKADLERSFRERQADIEERMRREQ